MGQNSNRRLNGINPLAYIGTNPYTPPDFVDYPFAPTPNDSKNVDIGTFWLNTAAHHPPLIEDVYLLVALDGGVATWIPLSSTGGIQTLTSNAGGAVSPLLGNINVVGDGTTITGVGNPGTHTITLSAIGTGLVQSLTGNSGGAVFPTAGNTNVIGTGSITVVGNPGTSTLTITPSGAIADSFPTDAGTAVPIAGVLNVLGGTGITTSGAGNTVTITNTEVVGAFDEVVMQVFTITGTYTPTANMKYCIIEVVGGGGGGGAAGSIAVAGSSACGGGGGAGGYSRGVFNAATIGASKAVTVGTGGAGGVAGVGNGATGGTTSVGALLQATGGSGAFHGSTTIIFCSVFGGSGGVATGGSVNMNGQSGTACFAGNTETAVLAGSSPNPAGHGGAGGTSYFGSGAKSPAINTAGNGAGTNAPGFGGGGSGAVSIGNNSGNAAGGNGADGIVVITEFLSV